MNYYAGQTPRHPSIVFGTRLPQAGSVPGSCLAPAPLTLPQTCGICQQQAEIWSPGALSARLLVPVTLTWSSEKPNILPAKMPSSTNPVNLWVTNTILASGNKITNSLEATACPQRHRICFSEGNSKFPWTLLSSANPTEVAGQVWGQCQPLLGFDTCEVGGQQPGLLSFWNEGSSSSQGTNIPAKPPWLHGTHTGSSHPEHIVLPLSFQQCAGSSFTFVLLADPSICAAAGPIQRPCACLPLLPAPAPAQPLSLEKQSVFPNKSPQSWVNPSDISPTAKAAELGLSPQPRSLRLVQRCWPHSNKHWNKKHPHPHVHLNIPADPSRDPPRTWQSLKAAEPFWALSAWKSTNNNAGKAAFLCECIRCNDGSEHSHATSVRSSFISSPQCGSMGWKLKVSFADYGSFFKDKKWKKCRERRVKLLTVKRFLLEKIREKH